MRKTLSVLALLSFAAAAFAAEQQRQAYVDTPQSSKTAIGTCVNPVPIQAFNESGGQAAQSAYISARYPGFTGLSRSRTTCNGSVAYRAKFRNADGKKVVLYFDARGYAGK